LKAGRLLFPFSEANVVLSFQKASVCSVGPVDATLSRLDAFFEALDSAGKRRSWEMETARSQAKCRINVVVTTSCYTAEFH
jgi:hypothetical protein